MNKLPNIHPGEVLEEEFLKPLHISAYRLAKETKIPQTRISEILKAKRRISADTALRLAKFFGTTPQFWLGLQNDYDLEESRKAISKDLIAIHPLAQTAIESQSMISG
jgi:addiction module HigA family antidote